MVPHFIPRAKYDPTQRPIDEQRWCGVGQDLAAVCVNTNHTFNIDQQYVYKCPDKNNGDPVKMKSYTIERKVFMQNGQWQATTKKDGLTSDPYIIP